MTRDKLIDALDAAIARIEQQITQLEAQRDALDNLENSSASAPSFAQRIAAAFTWVMAHNN